MRIHWAVTARNVDPDEDGRVVLIHVPGLDGFGVATLPRRVTVPVAVVVLRRGVAPE
jgi:hypothetical protein